MPAETLIDYAVLVAAAFVVVMGLAFIFALWWVRRHRHRLARMAGEAAWNLARRGGQGATQWVLSHPRPDRRWWARHSLRQKVQSAVAGAEEAVREADRAGVPVGDLPSLSRRLRTTAASLDAILVLDQRARTDNGQAEEQARGVIQAAGDIRAAAVLALVTVRQPETAALVADAEHELAALSDGLDRMRSGSRPGTPARLQARDVGVNTGS